jgi:Flp pilus assembly protein TadG
MMEELRPVARPPRGERGATLVEFAIVAPLLFLLIFGLIEVSWAFSQQVEVRHGARETARLAATDYGDLSAIVGEGCSRMHATVAGAQVTLTSSGAAVGETVTVEVQAPMQTLTGFLDPMLAGATVASSAEMRIERPPSWTDGVQACP